MGLWSRTKSQREGGEKPTPAAVLVKLERVAEGMIAGKTIAEIARDMQVPREAVRSAAKHPEVVSAIRATFEQRRNAAARELDAGACEAVRFLRESMNDTTNTTKERIRCAVELLDRGGFGRGVRIDVHNNDTGSAIEIDDVSALTDEQIEEAARIALERRARLRVVA